MNDHRHVQERVEELSGNAEPMEEAREAYRDSVIAQVEDGTADADAFPGYYLHRLRHTDGREVFALETVVGYFFSGVANTFHGLFESVDEAEKELSRSGLVKS